MKITQTQTMMVLALSLLGGFRSAATLAQNTATTPHPRPLQPYHWQNVNVTAGGFVDGLIFSPVQEGLAFARTDIGGAYRWDKTDQRWIPLNDWAGGKDGNLLGCESIGVDPVDAKRFYLALGTYTTPGSGNGAIVGTADGGRTWHRTNVPFQMGGNMDGRSAGERLDVDPNKDSILYMGSRNNGLWRSADYGHTWSPVTSFPVTGPTNGIGVVFEIFDASSGRKGSPTPTIYAAVSQAGPSLYKSTDAGKTWEPVPGQPAGLLPHHGVLAADGSLYLTYGNAPGPNGMTGGAVWKLDTHTGDWADITPEHPNVGGSPGFGYAGLALDPEHPGTVMVSTMDRWNPGDTLFRSRDGGKTWESLRSKSVRNWSLTPYLTFGKDSASFGWWVGALALDPFHPGHVLYGTGATIWASNDVTQADTGQPTHWYVGAKGVEETAVITLISPPAGAHLLSGLGDIGGFRHPNLHVSPASGMYTNPVFTNTDSLDFAQNNPMIVARVGRGDQGTHGGYSTDNGTTWTPFASAPSGSQGSGTIAVSADGKTLVWAAQGASPAFSHDMGATWQTSTGVPTGRASVFSDRVNPDTFYLFSGSQLYVSTDGGAAFTPRASLPNGVVQICATPGHEGDLWLTGGSKGLFHSTNGGATFAAVGDVPDAQHMGFGKAAPGHTYPALYLTGQTRAGEGGVFRSDNAGQTWVRINDNQHQYGYSGQVVTGDPRIYGRVYMGSNGRGILYADPITSAGH